MPGHRQAGGGEAKGERQAIGIAHQSRAADAQFGAQPLLQRGPPRLEQAAEQRRGKPDRIHALPPRRAASSIRPRPCIAFPCDTFIPKYMRQSRTTRPFRSEEHTSELQSLMRNSYADFCLKK